MTTLDLTAIRQALCDLVNTVDGCRGYPFVPALAASSTAASVAVWVAPSAGEYVGYFATFDGPGGALADVQMRLVPLVPLTDAQSAQRRLDQLLSSGTGQDRSLVDALTADATLGGVVEACWPTVASNIRRYDVDGVPALAADLELQVKVRRG